ncbi:nagb/rpia/CoA transferase-like protein [Pleomassaria siparia CBS 279.74]|uniref:Nagb/rpia/CoA transferase-like protein n=1 Tax=Pleomassaria siparia CBS 279.74 TaxID=1314801 RepID=A0A6G1K0W2_9PLEO|nr:nagb/rpia/CoA transferase-like protein [Pleomassaria siparia CBS 279.74]
MRSNSLRDSSPATSSPSKSSFDTGEVPSTPSRTYKTTALCTNVSCEVIALLDSIVQGMATDCVSGSCAMASSALSNLSTLIDVAADTVRNAEELWNVTIMAAKQMSSARLSVNAAVKSCLLRALAEIQESWKLQVSTEQQSQSATAKSPPELARIAAFVIQGILNQRAHADTNLGKSFTYWVKAFAPKSTTTTSTTSCSGPDFDNQDMLKIMTLGNPGSIYSGILMLLLHAPTIHIQLTILESRPRFVGPVLAAKLLSQAPRHVHDRLHIRVAPDCAVAAMAQDVDIVLLGADRISSSSSSSSTGTVLTSMGSLAAVVCTKKLQPLAKIVILTDAENIVAPHEPEWTPEQHPPQELTAAWHPSTKHTLEGLQCQANLDVFLECYEEVPRELIDVYLTEHGILDAGGVRRAGEQIGNLEKRFFG